MAKIKLADIIEPSVFTEYTTRRSTELSRLFGSGLVSTDEELNARAAEGGRTINMPYWNDLDGESEELSDSTALTPAKMDTGQDVAVKHYRGKSWAANRLAKHVSGSPDPMRVIGDRVAEWWARDMQRVTLLPSLKGIFATTLADTHVLDIAIADGANAADANLIGSDAIIDAGGLLGDHWDRITAMAMHSVPFRRLQKLNLIETVHLEDQRITINLFLGKEVIVDDMMPVVAGGTSGYLYTTYLFGVGAVGFGEADIGDEGTETDRDSLANDDVLISRRHFIMHPRGVAFTGSYTGDTPSKTDLETGANWTRRYDVKDIRVVKLVTNG